MRLRTHRRRRRQLDALRIEVSDREILDDLLYPGNAETLGRRAASRPRLRVRAR
jgi:hypothetical protein